MPAEVQSRDTPAVAPARFRALPVRLVPSWVWPRLNALGKLFHTTLFKLTLVYLTIFALFAACLLGYFAWNTRRLITEQITETVDAEVQGLSEQYRQGGIRRIVFAIEGR